MKMISVVIPVYNEVEPLRPLTEELLETMRDLGRDFEVLFVDDGSTDGTRGLLRKLAGEYPEVHFIGFRENCGQTSAMAAGFKHARGEILVTLDGDMQNDPRDIPKLLEMLDHYDVVCGWRKKRRDNMVRRISSRIANYVRNKLSDEEIVDVGCSLKAYRRESIQNLKLFEGMHRFFPTLLKLEGNRIVKAFVDLLAVRWMKKRYIRYKIEEKQ